MAMRELVIRARSYRRFRESEPVESAVLRGIVDMARYVPSSVNLQPLRYAISTSREVNALIFPHLVWARKLKEWRGPKPGERPAAYIVIGVDLGMAEHRDVDLGIACQTMFLGLAEAGLAGCMIGSMNAAAVHEVVGFPENVGVVQVMAVGRPGETVVVDELAPGGDSVYWRDAAGVHHVPKRGLGEVLLGCFE